MRRFLRRGPDGVGGLLSPRPQHFSVQEGGAGSLTTSNADGRFFFFGAPGTSLRVMAWVMLQSKADYSKVAQLGNDVSAMTQSWGVQYNVAADRWEMYKSNGVTFTSLFGGFSPLLNTWYGLAATFNYNSFSLDTYGLGGAIESVSVGLGDNGYNPTPTILGVGGSSIGQYRLTGRLDSLSISYSPLGNPAPSAVLFHGGLAPDYSELSAADLVLMESVRLWADFNERSGSMVYMDSGGLGSNLALNGSGLTRQPGAGY